MNAANLLNVNLVIYIKSQYIEKVQGVYMDFGLVLCIERRNDKTFYLRINDINQLTKIESCHPEIQNNNSFFITLNMVNMRLEIRTKKPVL